MSLSQTETAVVPDVILDEIEIAAPVARVWRALTDHVEFGQWFGAEISAPFRPGETVDAYIAEFRGGITVQMTVTAMEAPRRFVYTWHPYPADQTLDYSQEPETVIEFTLEPRDTGTLLKVRESGFSAIPAFRREEAFGMNTRGWRYQLINIERYVREH